MFLFYILGFTYWLTLTVLGCRVPPICFLIWLLLMTVMIGLVIKAAELRGGGDVTRLSSSLTLLLTH